MDETNKCYKTRINNGTMKKYFCGHILDVGGGRNPLKTPYGRVVNHDIINGDLGEDLSMYDDNAFETVYSSHCLEHIKDWEKAVKEWARVASKYVYIVVPDFLLYEKGSILPLFNPQHINRFSIDTYYIYKGDDIHKNLLFRTINPALFNTKNVNGINDRLIYGNLELCIVNDTNYDYSPHKLKEDQTRGDASAQIEVCYKLNYKDKK